MRKGRTPNPAIGKNRPRRPNIGVPPLQRIKRAPGEVNPRKGKAGGMRNQRKKMIPKAKQ
jgi:hypothetical protein